MSTWQAVKANFHHAAWVLAGPATDGVQGVCEYAFEQRRVSARLRSCNFEEGLDQSKLKRSTDQDEVDVPRKAESGFDLGYNLNPQQQDVFHVQSFAPGRARRTPH